MSELPPSASTPMTARAGESRQSMLARASARTAAGTLVSRVTGLVRLVMIAYALGGGRVGDAFNLANTTPNIVHDLVLGGVLAATFVPVFVDRLSRRSAKEANESISAVVSASALLLIIATIAFEIAAPWLVSLYTLGAKMPVAERELAVTLLRYFAPQLLCYGAISLMAAVLATRDRFAVVGIVPVVNNLIGIGVLVLFAKLDHTPELSLIHHPGLLALLGLGTTAGVAAQGLALVPSAVRADLHLRFVFRPSDPAVRTILSLSSWTFGIVATNQVAVFVILALADHLSGPNAGGVSAYTYAYTFFQFPFGIAAASIVNVATPDLARSYVAGDRAQMAERYGTAVRQMLAVILPATVGYLILARPAISLFLEHGAEGGAAAHLTSSVLVLFALGLPGYCVFFLSVRTFQAMQDTRTAFWCYLLENATNIAVALACYRSLGVEGLALSYSIAYGVGSILILILLRRRLGGLGGRRLGRATARALVLSIAMALTVALVSTLTGSASGLLGWLYLLLAVIAGGIVYLGGAGAAGTLASRRAAELQRARPSPRRGTARDHRGRH